jgi:DNA polymerase theta
MVAELAMIQCVVGRRLKSMMVLPYVALVKEKEKYMKRIVRLYNMAQLDRTRRVRIKAYHGDAGPFSCSRYDILICTIEKSNGLLNTLICQGLSHKLGCVVIDEMHLLGDRDRGFHLEILVR